MIYAGSGFLSVLDYCLFEIYAAEIVSVIHVPVIVKPDICRLYELIYPAIEIIVAPAFFDVFIKLIYGYFRGILPDCFNIKGSFKQFKYRIIGR